MPKNSKVAPGAASVTDEEMKGGLRTLFRQYDVDGNGHIDERELWAMLTEVIIASGVGKEGFSEEDAKTVMSALDDDDNGTVEETELVEWVVSGLKRPAADRESFARSSSFASRLNQFLTACGMLATKFANLPKQQDSSDTKRDKTPISPTKIGPSKTLKGPPKTVLIAINQASSTISGACDLLQLQSGLRLLFMHFNVSKSGCLDVAGVADIFDILPLEFERIKSSCSPEEIDEIAVSLPNICNRGDSKRVFEALDEDRSGLIDMDEWIQWFVAGSLRDPTKQVAFAGKSPFNLRLTHLLRVVVIIAQKLLPPTRVGDFQKAVNDIFTNACGKNEDTLSPIQLEKLVDTIQIKLKDFSCIFGSKDANEIHRALDSDGDGVITSVEWTSWILRGAALSFQERNKFSGKSDLHKRMCNFLEAVCILAGGSDLLHGMTLGMKKADANTMTNEQLTRGLRMLFEQFDTDKSGNIDQNELRAMMIDLPVRFYIDPAKIPTPEDVAVVMNALDADKSGEIDFDEWKEWIVGNRSMTETAREKFVTQSNAHFRLNGFVETICQITAEMTASLGEDNQLRPGLIQIFNESSNAEGTVGADEIFKMVAALSSKHPEVTWFDCDVKMAKTISEALDADGNGTVEVDEWVAWMLRGASRPALERAKFAAHSTTFMLLTKFLEAVSIVSKKLTLTSKTKK